FILKPYTLNWMNIIQSSLRNLKTGGECIYDGIYIQCRKLKKSTAKTVDFNLYKCIHLSYIRILASWIHCGIFCLSVSKPYSSDSWICSIMERLSFFFSSFLKYSFSFNVRFNLPEGPILIIFAFTVWPFVKY